MKRDVFQAIADPTRRAIVTLLASGAMTPTGITENFDMSRQAISKHIKALTECNIVTGSRSGRETYYRLNSEKMKEIADWLEPFRQLWEHRFNQLDNLINTLQRKT